MTDVIKAILESTEDFEAPTRFYYWSALAAVSAVMKDRVYFDMAGNYHLYPNIYVLLYGPSGVRKGPPIALAEELVMRVDNTRVIDGRSSIEAIIKELGTIVTREGKPLIKDACGFLVASELASSIIGNNSAMDIMTNFYDRQYNDKDWKYRLKNSESAKLSKPTITWLAGTNEALFRDFMPEKNLHGGLIGRTFIITESSKSKSNSLMFKSKAPDKERIAKRLAELSKIQGEFTMDDSVREAIANWYLKFDKETGPAFRDDTGFVSRVLDFIIKIGMLLAIARRGEKEIIIEDILESTQVVLPLIRPTQAVVNKVKREDASSIKKRSLVLTYLTTRPEYQAERSKMLQDLGLYLDHEDLDKIVQYMIQMQVLTIDQQGSKITYRLRVDRKEVSEFIKQYKT